jgi:hypothetical protein
MRNNNTCDMYKSSLRHTHDPVLSALKMEGIRLHFSYMSVCSHGVNLPPLDGYLSKLIFEHFTKILRENSSFINPFQSNFSANRILPSSYLFWAVKRLVDYL